MNCDDTARIPNQVQSDFDTAVDNDDADNNECDPDFSIPLKGRWHKDAVWCRVS